MAPIHQVVVAALGCLLLIASTQACTINEFTCDNSNCIPLGYVCDTGNDCEDGSDEKADICKGAPSGSLFGVALDGSANDIQVAVDLTASNNPYSVSGSLVVAVCGPKSCTGHELQGLDDRLEPRSYTVTIPGNNVGWSYSRGQVYNGITSWAPGILLDVAKHNRLLAVWPSGRPDLKRWIELQPDENVLSLSSSVLGNSTLLLKGSPQPVGAVLQPSEQVNVEVLVTRYQRVQVSIGLCNARTCASVQIETPFRNGFTTMDYSTGITQTNNPDDRYDSLIHPSGSTSNWAPARHQFSIAYHPDGFLQVWQPGSPDTVAEVPIPEDAKESPVLKAVALNGNLAYTRQGKKSRKELPVPRSHVRLEYDGTSGLENL